MAYRRVEDILKDPKSINPKQHVNLGSPFLKLEGLIVAKGLDIDFNQVLKRGLQLAIKEFKRNNKAEYDAMLKEYGGLLGKKK